MKRLVAAALAAALVGSSSGGAAVPYEPPSVAAPPAGTLIDLRIVSATELDESDVPLVPADITLTTETCEQQAPLVWRVSGTTNVPAAYKPTEISMLFSRSGGPGGNPSLDRYLFATLTGPGRFSLDINIEPYLGLPPREQAWLTWDVGEAFTDCALWPITDLGFRRAGEGRAQALRRTDPLFWPAPSGSIQRLGRGAVLADDTDPRRGWAYLAWQDLDLPMRRLWTAPPTVLPVLWVNAFAREADPCLTVVWGGPDASMQQRRRCGMRDLDIIGPSAVPGWSVAHGEGQRVLVRRRGQTVSIITAPTRAGREAIARAVRPYRNLRVGIQILGPEVGASLDTVVDLTLAPTNLVRRTVIREGRDRWLIATGLADPDIDTRIPAEGVPAAIAYRLGRPAGTWVATSGSEFTAGAVDNRHEPCVAILSGERFLAVAALNDATIEVRLADGSVAELATVDGVHIAPGGIPIGDYRALDAEGRPLRCGQGEWIEDGETRSNWTPPTARWALAVTATPPAPLQPGVTTSITGRGFHPEVAVDAWLCPGSATEATWFRPEGCEGGWETTANRRGRISLQLFVPEIDGAVDCSAGCHLRIESRYGTTRAAVLEVETLGV